MRILLFAMILLDAASLAQPNDEAQIHKSVFEKRELMNNYIELSMSMPVIGKGKGKGKGKGIDYSLSSKSSKASWSKSSKSKGKGSSKKSDKSGKGGGKEISLVPTVPTPTTAPIGKLRLSYIKKEKPKLKDPNRLNIQWHLLLSLQPPRLVVQ